MHSSIPTALPTGCVSQGNDVGMKRKKLPDNITQQDGYLLARISRGEVTRTRRFPYDRGSAQDRARAILAAGKWIDDQRLSMPISKNGRGSLREAPLAGKLSGEPVGVSSSVVPSRTEGRAGSLRYMVNWVDPTGKTRIKCFVAGPLDVVGPPEIAQARKAAHAFRNRYEAAVNAGESFDGTEFLNWRQMRF